MNLDSKLLSKNHIKQIEVKVAKDVGILSKLRFLFPKSTLLLLYYALVHPHLLYVRGCTYVGLYLSKIHTKTPTPSKQGHTDYLRQQSFFFSYTPLFRIMHFEN